jgi:hypothetical protein
LDLYAIKKKESRFKYQSLEASINKKELFTTEENINSNSKGKIVEEKT